VFNEAALNLQMPSASSMLAHMSFELSEGGPGPSYGRLLADKLEREPAGKNGVEHASYAASVTETLD
jgi:hypothetical protein